MKISYSVSYVHNHFSLIPAPDFCYPAFFRTRIAVITQYEVGHDSGRGVKSGGRLGLPETGWWGILSGSA